MSTLQALAERRSAVAIRMFMVVALLLVANVVLQWIRYRTGHDYMFGLVRLFDVDEEANLPTLFSTLLLFSAGVLLALISRAEKAEGGRDSRRWAILSIVFLFLTVDEAAMLHELFNVPGQEILGRQSPGIFYYAWVIPYSVLVLALGAYFIGFFLRLPPAIRVRFIVAAALFIGGSIGLELIEGVQDKTYGENNMTYELLTTLEEGMEMAGVIVFIHALLQYVDLKQIRVSGVDRGRRIVNSI